MSAHYARWLVAKGNIFSPAAASVVKLIERLKKESWISPQGGHAVKTVENTFGNDEFKHVVLEFEKKFDHKLPVSARGDTALHRSMGFDHRGRVDVALNPDGLEGRWLMRFLEQQKLPFFAFRTAVQGQATAPHIHMGPPSMRVRSTD